MRKPGDDEFGSQPRLGPRGRPGRGEGKAERPRKGKKAKADGQGKRRTTSSEYATMLAAFYENVIKGPGTPSPQREDESHNGPGQ